MRAVVTRVREASVTIEGRVNGAIGQGFLVLLGVGPNDTEAVCDKLAEKICNLRVFEDENGRMNRSPFSPVIRARTIGSPLSVCSAAFAARSTASARSPRRNGRMPR